MLPHFHRMMTKTNFLMIVSFLIFIPCLGKKPVIEKKDLVENIGCE